MKWLKFLGLVVLVLLAVPAFLPDHFEVERKILIDDSQADVYSYLVNLESSREWNPWLAEEPNAKIKFEGIPGVVGSFHEWEGIAVGHGRQTLIEVREPEYMAFKLEFMDPASPPAMSYMEVTPKGDNTQVVWGMRGALSYPFERVFGLMIPGMIGKKFTEGLENLKQHLENTKPATDALQDSAEAQTNSEPGQNQEDPDSEDEAPDEDAPEEDLREDSEEEAIAE